MKELLTNFREFQKLTEQINTLDSGKRFVGNRLHEVTEHYSTLQISDVELNKIRQWAKLTGEPEFLGSGSKGIAYKFDNKVLKITEDTQEALACSLIAGISHPNIYDVYGVARRDKEDKGENLRNMPFVIVYEFLDYPNKLMADVTQIMYYKVRKDDLYYNWNEENLDIFKKLVKQFLQVVTKDESILGKPTGKYQTSEPKLNAIVQTMGWSEEEQIIFIELWTLIGGMYNSNLNNLQSVTDHINDILNNPKLIYFHQLALGLSFLNKNGIIFTDLKNTNVMEKNGQIAIIDIGKSNVRTSKEIPSL
tara:strand:+ start:1649 stop:2569 length:921 start_codon:yes stop_codon:yes gene_type:complete